MSMSGIFEQDHFMFFADSSDFTQMRRNDPTHVHEHDRLSVSANFPAQIGRIHLQILALTIDEDDTCAGMNRRDCGRDKGMTWHNYGMAFDFESAQDDFKATSAVGGADGIFHTAKLCPQSLELSDVTPHADKAILQDL